MIKPSIFRFSNLLELFALLFSGMSWCSTRFSGLCALSPLFHLNQIWFGVQIRSSSSGFCSWKWFLFLLISKSFLSDVFIQHSQSFHLREFAVVWCLTACTPNFCPFSVTSCLKTIQLVLILFSSLEHFWTWGHQQPSLAHFLHYIPWSLMRIPCNIPNTQPWRAPWVIPFSQRISFSHYVFPFIQINTSCTFSELVQIPIFSCKEPFSMWPCVTYFTEVQINWIHSMSSRKSLAKEARGNEYLSGKSQSCTPSQFPYILMSLITLSFDCCFKSLCAIRND